MRDFCGILRELNVLRHIPCNAALMKGVEVSWSDLRIDRPEDRKHIGLGVIEEEPLVRVRSNCWNHPLEEKLNRCGFAAARSPYNKEVLDRIILSNGKHSP